MITKIIEDYAKQHGISREKYELYPLYLHLDGFTHSIGFIDHEADKYTYEPSYTSVSYCGWTGEVEGGKNDYQRELAKLILSQYPHSLYQNNAKEVLF